MKNIKLLVLSVLFVSFYSISYSQINSYAFDAVSKTLCSVEIPAGSITPIGDSVGENVYAGDSDFNNNWYGIVYDSGELVTIDTETGVLTTIGTGVPNALSFAIDQSSGIAYVMDVYNTLHTVNLTTGVATSIGGTYEGVIIGLASDNNGSLYAVSSTTLYSVNITDGSKTEIGQFGLTIGSAAIGIDFDNNGILYIPANVDSNDGLYSINTSTGEATFITALSTQLTGLAFMAEESANTLTFNVTDGTNPIENANINIYGTDLYTNAAGLATIDLVDGTYNYTVNYTGYDQETGSITINGSPETLNITLNETTYTTTFSVTDGTNQLENVTVYINNTNIYTNHNGIATTDLVNGTYAYTVNLDGYEQVTGDVIVSNAIQNIDIVLPELTYTTSFTITDGTNPIENANININDTDIQTNENGIATIELTNGNYSYTVNYNGYDELLGTVTVNNNSQNIDLTLNETTYILSFTVTDGATPLENANININQTDIITNENGIATINLTNGTYNYSVTLSDYSTFSSVAIINGANENISVPLTLVSINQLENNLLIFPNPTNGIINLQNHGAIIQNITVFNQSGALVKKYTTNNSQLSIDLTDCNTGTYTIIIQTNNESIIKNIIKK